MQSINQKEMGLAQILDEFDCLLRELPEMRGRMFEEIGRAVLGQVRQNIGGAGKVQGWQGSFVGSKGGYAAVRAKAKTYDGKYAVGYITNAIENGHKQTQSRYIPALGKKLTGLELVSGKHFYADARPSAETVAYGAAERFLRALTEKLEG